MKYRLPLAFAGLPLCFLAACGGDEPSVAQAAVVAGTDTFTLAPGGTANVLTNDTFNGAAATIGATGNVRYSAVGSAIPSGLSIVDGAVTVAATVAPGTYSFSYQICDAQAATNCSTATASVQVLRQVTGVLVGPELLAQASASVVARSEALHTARALSADGTARALSAACPDVPVAYVPLSNVTVTPLRADGTTAGATFTTNDCGTFTTAVTSDVARLSIAATAAFQARVFDVAAFSAPKTAASTLPVGATYEIASLYRLDTNRIGLSVIDSVSKKAVLGLPPSAVTAKVDDVATAVTAFATSVNATPSSTQLVMDASGSMATTVFTDATTNKVYNRLSLASIAAGEFVSGKLSTDEVGMTIFDGAVASIDDTFLAARSFVTAATGAPATVRIGASGFTTDNSVLLTVSNLFNNTNAIYQSCYLNGALRSTCYDYLPNSDTSLRLTGSYPFGGSTALWKATETALDKLNTRTNNRKFVVAMTDGEDNASGASTSTTLIAKAKQLGIPVSMVAFGAAGAVNGTAMQKVATDTGGSYYRQESSGIIGIFQAIQTGIRFQYSATVGSATLTTGQRVSVTVDTTTREITVP